MTAAAAFAKFLYEWSGIATPAQGPDALRHVVGVLQGYPMPYSELEDRIIPARVRGYVYGDLDGLCERDELVWQGHERISPGDGVLSIYRPQDVPGLARITQMLPGERREALRQLLIDGPLDYPAIVESLGGFPPQILATLWDMVWAGEVSNRRLLPLQSLRAERVSRKSVRARRANGRARRWGVGVPPGAAGEWRLVMGPDQGFATPEARDRAQARQLLKRWGVVSRRALTAGRSPGGERIHRALERMHADGKLSRGEFLPGLGEPQYASSFAVERLVELCPERRVWTLAATDPANPYGFVFPWPKRDGSGGRPQRTSGATVILYGGEPLGYLGGGGENLLTFGSSEVADSTERIDALISGLIGGIRPGAPLILRSVDGLTPARSELAGALKRAGFSGTRRGYVYRV